MKIRILPLVLLLACLAQSAMALPAVWTISDTDDNTTLTLYVLEQVIEGDTDAWCYLHVEVDGDSSYPVRTGDVINVSVWESDGILLPDDLIWQLEFSPTSAEAAVSGDGLVDRFFDCSGNFQTDDTGTNVEVYAEGVVDWDCCYYDDDPVTGNISIPIESDDTAEEDDAREQAKPIGLGTTGGRIANDSADWMSFELTGAFDVDLDLFFDETGILLPRLEDGSSNIVATFVPNDDGSSTLVSLPAATYYLIVSPHTASDPNFYDVRLTVTPSTCTTGQTETRDCGNCGTQTRECIGGTWTAFGSCTGEGICTPAATTTEGCELCGTRTTVCTDECEWGAPGACEDQGVCEAGEIDVENCPSTSDTRQRQCQEDCTWGEWTECGSTFCNAGDSRACYTGPEETRLVGSCHDGIQGCVDGNWAGCEGQQLPVLEICDDTLDNDCDSYTDAADSDCGDVLTGIGAPCTTTVNCEDDYECVGPPDDPMFVGGYCGGSDCSGDAECGEGVCLNIFAEEYCLRPCTNASDCRTGYMCVRIQGVKACIPRCTTNDHCRDTSYPVCDLETGRCVEGSVVLDPEPVEPVADAGQDPGVSDLGPDTVTPDTAQDVPAPQDVSEAGAAEQLETTACSCTGIRTGASGSLGLLLILSAAFWFRRRR